jgi:diguanylate cyclase (GGDEF)-like protein/PAS domain S-box-containing protein
MALFDPDLAPGSAGRRLFDGMAAAMLIADENGRYLDANRAASDLLGYAREEFIGQSFGWLSAKSMPLPGEARRLLAAGPQRVEWEIRRKDGTIAEVEAYISAVTLPSGRIYLAVLTDMSERRRMETALLESEAWLHSIVETSPDLISVLDQAATFRFVNSAYGRTLGYTPDALIGRSAADFVHPDEVADLSERFAALMQPDRGDGPADELGSTYRTRHADGHWVAVEAKWRVLRGPDDAITGLLIISRDVTERLRAQDALRTSEERFRSLVQNAADVVAIVDADSVVRYVSPAVERAIGYRSEVFVDTPGARWIHPDDESAVRAVFERVGREAGGQEAIEFRARHRDGSICHFRAVFTNLSHLAAVGGVVVNAHDITEQVALERQLIHQAFHDPLTGLPNRALLLDRLAHALARAARRNSSLGVLLLDLDHFKVVNDSLGHQAGDDLLVQVARRLEQVVDPSDTVARLGGDEFTVLTEDVANSADVSDLAQRLLRSLGPPFTIEARPVHISASIGTAVDGVSDRTPADLLREADIALYEAKAAGRARAVRFAPHMNAAARRLEVEGGLRRALDRGELGTGTVAGVEALARWDHPERGPVDPGEFIPIAEETGLIVELWRWLVEEASGCARGWQPLRADGTPLHLSVNISANHFQQPTLLQQVERALSRTGL